MSNIQTNFIDFRNEHRLYVIDGFLQELVGMIAITDFDSFSDLHEDADPSPETYYKFICDSQFMHDGGSFSEGELPHIFAHRGDIISIYNVMNYLLKNIYFNTDSPICLLERFDDYNLSISEEHFHPDITISLCDVKSSYRIETSLGHPLMFIEKKCSQPNMVSLTIDGYHIALSYKKIIMRLGKIIYGLRSYMKRKDIRIKEIWDIKDWVTPTEKKNPPTGWERLPRLVDLAAEIHEKYWNNILKED